MHLTNDAEQDDQSVKLMVEAVEKGFEDIRSMVEKSGQKFDAGVQMFLEEQRRSEVRYQGM